MIENLWGLKYKGECENKIYGRELYMGLKEEWESIPRRDYA